MIMIEPKAIIDDRLAGVADAEPAIAPSGGPGVLDATASRAGRADRLRRGRTPPGARRRGRTGSCLKGCLWRSLCGLRPHGRVHCDEGVTAWVVTPAALPRTAVPASVGVDAAMAAAIELLSPAEAQPRLTARRRDCVSQCRGEAVEVSSWNWDWGGCARSRTLWAPIYWACRSTSTARSAYVTPLLRA